MALVDSRPYSDPLHGSVELVENSSQASPTQTSSEHEDNFGSYNPGLCERQTETSKQDEIILVTVKPLATSTTTSQISVPQSTLQPDRSPLTDQEASRRRYSVMMASLAAARVEESKASLRRNSAMVPAGLTGVSSGPAKGGWEWQKQRDLEDDFALREKYFADEL
ncbi:uncharacterized protein RCC_01297 [Ramularia collo-cygni]|uniref:Uncharacterized protein n=1 Tax=Ramularia collo-cygni TaxID=112498 RepID=A0A2D3V1R0_9PEZI|nr:uncharacterized protein RCC_01297 [Ramularia collo-cygni]CZT15439.1 uncharacterized protein RCC_01297 [Ramularia collo-cygni]